MYKLSGKDKNGNEVILDEVPDSFVVQHNAEYCGQYWPDYTDFVLIKINEVENGENTQAHTY